MNKKIRKRDKYFLIVLEKPNWRTWRFYYCMCEARITSEIKRRCHCTPADRHQTNTQHVRYWNVFFHCSPALPGVFLLFMWQFALHDCSDKTLAVSLPQTCLQVTVNIYQTSCLIYLRCQMSDTLSQLRMSWELHMWISVDDFTPLCVVQWCIVLALRSEPNGCNADKHVNIVDSEFSISS